MSLKQPTFLRHGSVLYALFHGTPNRGKTDVISGYWVADCSHLAPAEREMAFQVCCHGISHFSTMLALFGMFDQVSIRIQCVLQRKLDVHSILRSAWLNDKTLKWKWVEQTHTIPEEAVWLPSSTTLGF